MVVLGSLQVENKYSCSHCVWLCMCVLADAVLLLFVEIMRYIIKFIEYLSRQFPTADSETRNA